MRVTVKGLLLAAVVVFDAAFYGQVKAQEVDELPLARHAIPGSSSALGQWAAGSGMLRVDLRISKDRPVGKTSRSESAGEPSQVPAPGQQPGSASGDRQPRPDSVQDANKGCWFGKADFAIATNARWSGPCSGGYGEGEGSLSWFDGPQHLATYTGTLRSGLPHGRGSLTVTASSRRTDPTESAVSRHGSTHDILTADSGYHYAGQFEAGRPHGKGVLKTSAGLVIDGSFENGLPHGDAVAVMPNGDRYEGQFQQGKRSGRGAMIVSGADGKPARIENGMFVDGLLHGAGGKIIFPGNRELAGTFSKGELIDGSIRFEDGVLMAGQFKNQKLHGPHGRQVLKDGVVMEGHWVDGQLHGIGRLRHPDGSVLSGNFQYNRLHGDGGRIVMPSGEVWEGRFVNGRLQGKGLHKSPTGYTYEGDFVDGKEEGQGRRTWKDGSSYQGSVKGGVPHGRGDYRGADGSFYDGDWVDGVKHGRGRMVYADGGIYDGEWKDDKRHGRGKFVFKTGAVYEGNFVHDQRDDGTGSPARIGQK